MSENMMNNGIDFNLNDLEKLIKSAEEMKKEAEVDSEKAAAKAKMDHFTRIVKGVSRKYASKWVDREDLEQDLWVRVLELVDACGGIEYTDEKLVASVCYKKAVDVYRYCRRRYESNVRLIDNQDGDSDGPDYFDSLHNSIDNIMDTLLFKEVIEVFDQGSKERKYIVIKLVSSGVIDKRYLNKEDQELFKLPDGDTEADILRVLGYKSHCPGSWTVKKRTMESIIKEFLK